MRERQKRVKELIYQKTRANEIKRTEYFEKIRVLSTYLLLPTEKSDEAFRSAFHASGLSRKDYVNAALFKIKEQRVERIPNFAYCGNVIGRLTIVAAKNLLLSLL